ncbi:MAG: HPF/RaiA family ribosome-associated protein [Treponemataceae bacterium]|nr:HPF/RaiA family ribosome-associated protein [Treponemataceae bacterium]
MTTSISGVNLTLRADQQAYLNKKLDRIKYADDLITDLLIKVKHDEKKIYIDATMNFRWGVSAHVSADDFDFEAAVNKLMDTLDQKVKKEKDKVQQR